MKKVFFLSAFFLLVLFAFPQKVFAQSTAAEKPLGGGNCTDQQLNTAIGCIPIFGGTSQFLGFFLKWGVGIGGGIAFILIIIASFMTMTSTGNPERLKAGQELLTSAIIGLIMIIFSVFILKVIGIDILNIPGIT